MDRYRARDVPQCSTSYGWTAVDATIAVLSAIVAVTAAGDDTLTSEERNSFVLSGTVDGLVHGISAIAGAGWASECRRANEMWASEGSEPDPTLRERTSQRAKPRTTNPRNDPAKAFAYWCAPGDGLCFADEARCRGACTKTDEVWCAAFKGGEGKGYLCGTSRNACSALKSNPDHYRDRWDLGECVIQFAALDEPKYDPLPMKADKPAVPTAPTPRGFYCASSPTVARASTCTREKSECERAREGIAIGVSDIGACALVEAAVCFGDRCAHVMDSCTAQRNAAIAGGEDATTLAACEEAK